MNRMNQAALNSPAYLSVTSSSNGRSSLALQCAATAARAVVLRTSRRGLA